MKVYLSAILAVSLLSACSHNSQITPVKVDQNYAHTFTSVGYAPIEAQPGNSFDMKVLNAIKASKLEAYKEMAEQVFGVLIAADGSIDGSVLGNNSIEAKVKGLVKGAKVMKSYHEGDVYITELELDMKTLPFLQAPEFKHKGSQAIRVEDTVYY
ncbi:LPP20 family lipoprotein [Psychromonas sp. KJ10-10]|uniref:LPP20 family lipoprotein n=1 Tax=Psychromonas sp. KJ10-10 TaxID=3391823 RepID=UPI0039B5554E